MSVIAQLSAEISTLITESRRRNNEVKTTSERSLSVLKTFDPKSKDEIQFLKDLSQDGEFIAPFLLSFTSRNAKFSSISIQSLNKLIQYSSIPVSKIDNLLDGLIEATYLAMDIQLKILQVLPTFYQIYGEFINDGLLTKFLRICSILQASNKSPMVINTASATEQQIILSLFDKAMEEDKKEDLSKTSSVTIYGDQEETVTANSLDAFRVFKDYCSLINNDKAEFLPFASIQESSALELIENILNNNTITFQTHSELIYLLKTRLAPILLRSFSTSKNFPIVVRVSRIILLLIKNHLSTLEIEAEVILSLLNLTLTKDSNLPTWKKILSLEIFNSVLTNFDNIFEIFKTFDNRKDKKNILFEFLTNCNSIIFDDQTNRLLNLNEIVTVPSQDAVISTANSSLRNYFIDQLDKQEPPQPPRTYIIYLILNAVIQLGDGIGKQTVDLSNQHKFSYSGELKDIPSSATQVQGLIKTNAKSLISLGSEFLYSSIHSDLFHSLVRSLQKICHSSGILNLSKERDSLLYMFSIATISNNQKDKSKSQRNVSITESITETINYATGNTTTTKPTLQPRNLNARHIICFRALTSLTISLGPILGDSWRFVLTTFQWFSYYIDGPSSFLLLKDIPSNPQISPNDAKVIESLMIKMNEHTRNYTAKQYNDLLLNLITLGKESSFKKYETNDYFIEPISDNGIELCPFNKDFFTATIGSLSELNILRFLKEERSSEVDNWKVTFDFLGLLIVSHEIIQELRIISSDILNNIFKKMADEGFASSQGETIDDSDLETRLFESISDIINKMLSSHSDETISTNTESQMIYETLNTLNELLDRFGTSFQSSWVSIIKIVNTPFLFYDQLNNETAESAESSHKRLLQSSFEILQLILNDFLQSLPIKNFELIVDVLQKFCTQKAAINTSFSAVSYYWLISDHFRALLVIEGNEDTKEEKETLSDLWLYLLSSLVKVSSDTRVDVKNGAIQTFFRIVDSHGDYLDWNRVFNSVVKTLLSTELTLPEGSDYESKSKFKENCKIILKGVTDIYSRFIINLKGESYWNELLAFCNNLLKLDIIDISKSTYQSVYQILGLVDDINKKDFDIVFDFWSSQHIKYISNDTVSYQNMAIEYIRLFERFNKPELLSKNQLDLSLSIFNNVVRFPFLPSNTVDSEACTQLQTIVFETLERFDVKQEYIGSILVNLSSLTLLPFHTRSKILKKLSSANRDKLSSFIYSSITAITILRSKLNETEDLSNFIKDETLVKIFKNLIESIKSKVDDDPIHSQRIDHSEIWKRSLGFLLDLTIKITSANTNIIPENLWNLIIESIVLTLPGNNDEREGFFNLKCYKKFKEIVMANLNHISSYDKLVNRLVSSIWNASLLYENNEIENYLFSILNSTSEVPKALAESNIPSFTTEPLQLLSQREFRFVCFEDLFSLSTENINYEDENNKALFNTIYPFLLCRAVMAIKRYDSTQRLLNHAPVPTIQQTELQLTLNKLLVLLRVLQVPNLKDQQSHILTIFPLILNSTLYSSKLGANGVISEITSEFYKLSSDASK